jgi:hypothetical protein
MKLNSRRRFLQVAASSLVLRSPGIAQQDPVFSTEVKVVNVFATVRSPKGEILRNLTQDDFTLL